MFWWIYDLYEFYVIPYSIMSEENTHLSWVYFCCHLCALWSCVIIALLCCWKYFGLSLFSHTNLYIFELWWYVFALDLVISLNKFILMFKVDLFALTWCWWCLFSFYFNFLRFRIRKRIFDVCIFTITFFGARFSLGCCFFVF